MSLRLDGEGFFCGYVFTRARSAGGRVEVTAYDQLRYLRSRDTLLYEGKTASALLRMLAADFRLTLGDVEETGYAIPIGAEENVPVWDMVENALDETYRATGRRYVLYDDFGKICLKSAGEPRAAFTSRREHGERVPLRGDDRRGRVQPCAAAL